MKVVVLWAVEDDGADVFEMHLLGIFHGRDSALLFWDSLTPEARYGYDPMLEDRTIGTGLVPCLSQLSIARSGGSLASAGSK